MYCAPNEPQKDVFQILHYLLQSWVKEIEAVFSIPAATKILLLGVIQISHSLLPDGDRPVRMSAAAETPSAWRVSPRDAKRLGGG